MFVVMLSLDNRADTNLLAATRYNAAHRQCAGPIIKSRREQWAA